MLETPILFLVFNRPETTKKVLDQIRISKPSKLYVAADGPRTQVPEDEKKCDEVRKMIENGIDWECQLKTLYRDTNLGCGIGVYKAIDWFFEQEEMGIILEDDCVPAQSFFSFCHLMLEKYKDEETIHQISGSNFQFGKSRGKASYYFSNYNICWGWATWKRSWSLYQYTIDYGPNNSVLDLFDSKEEKAYWDNVLSQLSKDANQNHIWDYQWYYCMWKNNKLAICPQQNLIQNIGFGSDATHTTQTFMSVNNVPFVEIDTTKLVHPFGFEVNKKADRITFRHYFSSPTSWINKMRNIAYRIFPEFVFSYWRRIKS